MAESTDLLAVVLPVLVGTALIGIASLVVRHGQGHRHNALFAALYMLSGLKSIGEGLRVKADDFIDAGIKATGQSLFPPSLFWELLGLFCALGMMPLLFLFVSHFPRPLPWTMRAPRSAGLAFLPSAMVALLLVLAVAGLVPGAAYLAAVSGFNLLFFAVTVAAVLLLLRTWKGSPDPIERKQATYVLLGFVPGFTAGWTISLLQFLAGGALDGATADRFIFAVVQFISPTFELLACLVVAFAILKYNLLGVDPRFRLGVKSSIVGLLFISIFLISQVIESVVLEGQVFNFAGPYGSFLLSGISGVVLFKPIERLSEKVSNRLVPSQEGDAALQRAEEVYHAQASYVLRDAKVTEREMALLRNLREQLGLTEAQARRIEEDVERLLKVDAPETGQKATGATAAPSFTGLALAKREAAAVHDEAAEVRAASPSHAAVPKPAPKARAPSTGKAAKKPSKPAPRPAPKKAAKPSTKGKAPARAPKGRT